MPGQSTRWIPEQQGSSWSWVGCDKRLLGRALQASEFTRRPVRRVLGYQIPDESGQKGRGASVFLQQPLEPPTCRACPPTARRSLHLATRNLRPFVDSDGKASSPASRRRTATTSRNRGVPSQSSSPRPTLAYADPGSPCSSRRLPVELGSRSPLATSWRQFDRCLDRFINDAMTAA